MHDDASGDEGADLVGVRILLTQAIRFRQGELCGEVRTYVMPVVDRGRDELSAPVAEELERRAFGVAHSLIVSGAPPPPQGLDDSPDALSQIRPNPLQAGHISR